jgi:hypothetical protein
MSQTTFATSSGKIKVAVVVHGIFSPCTTTSKPTAICVQVKLLLSEDIRRRNAFFPENVSSSSFQEFGTDSNRFVLAASCLLFLRERT